ncbi:DUF3467 domain-containing protein [Tuwongella immobilis]|uniref:DUF3467 domain-containing protein n=1 Tax=Tuwongella immobilis TaxID=692036 RepID=A0A6C2YTD2_9BACT|nr:DUF3467 domain-containing protein [Tuwongella immobilis]VIP04383.1 Uncharacterized protein OS=Pirellula staleyi (strain ATCC 27377 / DSM 6068 / ICPB 4128) GN=Psta_0856 PE=4 SV=1: DUF3467 [Tuwongella immobilis]VTS06128.1 Uncharacterized protein OS=Pirellula staleyi (strain ATCC 27377 / DSM 6068 / ICPB 4128) GN=Psta_0856 PE=4 SV=1: DUF3467 [Tuwongella immobilis]
MADEKIPDSTQAPGTQMQVPIDADEMQTAYTNFFRVTGTFEELVLDFGLHTQMMTASGPEAVHLSQRLVMSFYTAKRLLNALQWAVSRHENNFGVLETDPQKRLRPGLRPSAPGSVNVSGPQ